MTRIAPANLPEDLPVHNNLVRATYNNPDMHRGFASLSGRVHSASHVPSRTRELVILRVCTLLNAQYELDNHRFAASRSGVPKADIDAAVEGRLDAFPDAEHAAMRFGEAVERGAVDDAAWSDARAHYSEVELADIAMLAAFYGLASRFAMAMDIDAEDLPADTSD